MRIRPTISARAAALRSSAFFGLAPLACAQAQEDRARPGKYIGPGSCAATSCHGSVKPVADSRILQNEYSTWILKDKHSRAYQALTGDVGERMARILKLGAKAEEAPKCLACHALLHHAGAARSSVSKSPKGSAAKTATVRPRLARSAHRRAIGTHEKSVALRYARTRAT